MADRNNADRNDMDRAGPSPDPPDIQSPDFQGYEELFRLTELAMSQQATESQIRRLGLILKRDKRARELYAQTWLFDLDLKTVHQLCGAGEESSQSDVANDRCLLPSPGQEKAGPPGGSTRSGRITASYWVVATAILLAVTAGYLVRGALLPLGPGGSQASTPSNTGPRVAWRANGLESGAEQNLSVRLTKASRCVWGSSAGRLSGPHMGGVKTGKSLELLEGFATFSVVSADWKATVQIEGPAAIVTTSDGLPALRHGKMLVKTDSVTDVPLSIELPYAQVYLMPDSEVGVGAFGGVCETHVFRGMASLESLWSVEPEDAGQGRRHIVPEGSSLTLTASEDSLLSVKEGHANRGAFDAGTLIKGGQLVVTSEYVKRVRESSPVAYWRFEDQERDIVRNSVADRHHLHVNGDVKFRGLTGNRYVSFPLDQGASQPRYLATSEPISPALPNDYTIEFWFNPIHYQTSTVATFVVPERTQQDPDPDASQHGMLIELGGFSGARSLMRPRKLRFLHRKPADDKGGESAFSDLVYSVRQWQHVVCSKEGPLMRVYLNGQLCGKDTENTNLPVDLIVVIGQISDGRFQRSFYGQLDEFAIYDRALSVDEAHKHFRAAQFVGLTTLGEPSIRKVVEF